MPNARQGVFNAIDNQSSPYARSMRAMQGIPTAQQEALQQPLIDPVFTAALGPAFGMRKMLASLAMQALRSELPGATPTQVGLAGIPAPAGLFQGALRKIGENMYRFARGDVLEQMGGLMEGTPLEEQLAIAHGNMMDPEAMPQTLADHISDWKDMLGRRTPDLLERARTGEGIEVPGSLVDVPGSEFTMPAAPDPTAIGGGNIRPLDPSSQIASQYIHLIRPPAPLPYPGAEIGRPLGLAALLHMMRGAFGAAPVQAQPSPIR